MASSDPEVSTLDLSLSADVATDAAGELSLAAGVVTLVVESF